MNETAAEKSERAIITADPGTQTAFVDGVEHKWGRKDKHGGGDGMRRGPRALSANAKSRARRATRHDAGVCTTFHLALAG